MKPRYLFTSLILLYLIVFVIMIGRSLNMEFNGELTALLPAENNHIETYNELSRLNSSEGGFEAVIRSTNGENILAKATKVVDELLVLEANGNKIFKNAELENDLFDIKYSALYLMTEEELDSVYKDVSRYIEEEKQKANPVYVDFSEDDSDSKSNPVIATESSVLLSDLSNSDRYRINTDTSIIKVLFLPEFQKSDHSKLEETYQLIQSKSVELESQIPGMEIYWGGSYIRQFNKINDVQYAILKALVIGVLSLFVFLIAYMLYINRRASYKKRYIATDLLLMFFTLLSGFIISLGISSLFFDEINVFTGIIFSILFGINLDYILHVYSINKETGINFSNLKQLRKKYFSSSRPIILSCLTTGLAVMSLVFSDFKGFKQFGLIFFINVVVNLIGTYLFMLMSPSTNKKNVPQKDPIQKFKQSNFFFSNFSNSKKKVLHLGFFTSILIAGFFGAQNLTFNFSFSDLEPQSVRNDYDIYSDELDTGNGNHDPTFFIANNIYESKDLFRHLKDGLENIYTDIDKVESFSARFPITAEEISSKESKIGSLQNLINKNEQYLNLNEDSEGSELIDIALNTVPPQIDSLPKYIKNRFLFQDNSIAPMVIVYSKMSLSNGKTAIKFRKSSGSVEVENGKTYYAASTSIIASSILELLIEETRFLLLVPMFTICGLLLVNYRSFKDTCIALSPLFITFLILISLEPLFQFQINLYNVVVLPIIIGVGADNGIHLVDSIKKNGKVFLGSFITEKYPVLAACSITTVLGFVGLLFINHPGMESLGMLAIVGICTALFATLITATAVATFQQRN